MKLYQIKLNNVTIGAAKGKRNAVHWINTELDWLGVGETAREWRKIGGVIICGAGDRVYTIEESHA